MRGGSITNSSAFRRRLPHKIVFTASSSTFTVPNSTIGQGSANTLTSLSIGVGTGLFSGVTSFLNAATTTNIQSFAWRVTATSPTTSTGGSRPVDIRFNRITLVGACYICGPLLMFSSDGFGVGTFPATGMAYNCGVTGGAKIQAGRIYGLAPITFAVPNTYSIGDVSFSADSLGLYIITLRILTRLNEKDNHLRYALGFA